MSITGVDDLEMFRVSASYMRIFKKHWIVGLQIDRKNVSFRWWNPQKRRLVGQVFISLDEFSTVLCYRFDINYLISLSLQAGMWYEWCTKKDHILSFIFSEMVNRCCPERVCITLNYKYPNRRLKGTVAFNCKTFNYLAEREPFMDGIVEKHHNGMCIIHL